MKLERSITIILSCFAMAVLTRAACGGMHTSPEGSILYKYRSPVLRNERCVWFIQVPNATQYSVDLRLGNDPVLDNKLIITEFQPTQNATHKYPLVSQTMISRAKVIMVTFYTSAAANSNNTGFSLLYEARNGISDGPRTHHYSIHNGTSITYPSPDNIGLINYPNNDLTLFAFLPQNNLFRPNQITSVCYNKIGLEGISCFDHITFYMFDYSSKWRIQKRLCGNIDSSRQINHDLLLAVFESDVSYHNRGFKLEYKPVC